MAIKITDELLAVEVEKGSSVIGADADGDLVYFVDGKDECKIITLPPENYYQYICLASEIVRTNNVKGILDYEFTGIDFAYRNKALANTKEYALLRIIK